MNCTDCPLSMVGFDGDIIGVEIAGSTMNGAEYTEVTVFAPASVTITFASSGLLDVSADTVWNVNVLDVDESPVSKELCAIVPGVIAFTTSILYVNGDAQYDSDAVKLSYCPTSTIEFYGLDIDA